MVQASLDGGFNLDLPEPVLAALLTLSPELRLEFPHILANERLDPEAEQQRLFDSIITWFSALNKQGELLLVIEDIHWADSGSLALLRYLTRHSASAVLWSSLPTGRWSWTRLCPSGKC